MSDLADVAPLPRRHPGPAVLELAELVVGGLLERLPADPAPDVAGPVVLEDAEGTPVALLAEDHRAVSALRPFTGGPLRAARRPAAEIRDEVAALGPDVLAVPVTGSMTVAEVEHLTTRAAGARQGLLWLAVVGDGRTADLAPLPLWRATRAMAAHTGRAGIASSAAVLVAPRDLPAEDVAGRLGASTTWSPLGTPSGPLHPAFAEQHARAAAAPRYPGATVFLTGLSGSGKSTVAKALADRLTEGSSEDDGFDGRTVTLLDGDEVRRMLSAGLGFGREDRELNIQRIGYVAAEVSRHGGLAVCAPIAPFESTRAAVAARVREAGGRFVLVHVSTPLEECERRDRKGLYARARAGEIADFTGISSPYEVPPEPDLRLDTTGMSLPDGVEAVWSVLRSAGLFDPAVR